MRSTTVTCLMCGVAMVVTAMIGPVAAVAQATRPSSKPDLVSISKRGSAGQDADQRRPSAALTIVPPNLRNL